MTEETEQALRTSRLFLDTQAVIEANCAYKAHRLSALTELATLGRVQVVMTEVTVREIKAHIREAVGAPNAGRPSPILKNSQSPAIRALFEPIDREGTAKELLAQLDEFIKDARILVLPVSGNVLEPVLEAYFDGRAPFGPGKNKAEFPDAIALELVREWAATEDHGVAVVSRDAGIRDACEDDPSLHYFESLSAYLDAVASESEALAAFIRETITLHDEAILEGARDAFGDLGFHLRDEDGDVDEVSLKRLDYEGSVDIISLTADEAVVEMPVACTFDAQISYYVPGTGTYDREDGIMLFQETAEASVERVTRRTLTVEVSFQDLDPDSFEVRSVSFEGQEAVLVRSDLDDDWPYK